MAARLLLWVSVVVAASTIALCSWAIHRKALLEERLEWIESQLEILPMVASKTWVSGGSTVTVTTERKKNADGSWAETAAAWKARHAADVAEAQAQFPPDADG